MAKFQIKAIVRKKDNKQQTVEMFSDILKFAYANEKPIQDFKYMYNNWSCKCTCNIQSFETIKSKAVEQLKLSRLTRMLITAIIFICALESFKSYNKSHLILGFWLYITIVVMDIASTITILYYGLSNELTSAIHQYLESISTMFQFFSFRLNMLRIRYNLDICMSSALYTEKHNVQKKSYSILLFSAISLFNIYGIAMGIVAFALCHYLDLETFVILEGLSFYLTFIIASVKDVQILGFIRKIGEKRSLIKKSTTDFLFWFESKCGINKILQQYEASDYINSLFPMKTLRFSRKARYLDAAIVITACEVVMDLKLPKHDFENLLMFLVYGKYLALNELIIETVSTDTDEVLDAQNLVEENCLAVNLPSAARNEPVSKELRQCTTTEDKKEMEQLVVKSNTSKRKYRGASLNKTRSKNAEENIFDSHSVKYIEKASELPSSNRKLETNCEDIPKTKDFDKTLQLRSELVAPKSKEMNKSQSKPIEYCNIAEGNVETSFKEPSDVENGESASCDVFHSTSCISKEHTPKCFSDTTSSNSVNSLHSGENNESTGNTYENIDGHDKKDSSLNEEGILTTVTKQESKAAKGKNSYLNYESSNELKVGEKFQSTTAYSERMIDNSEKVTPQKQVEQNPLLMDLEINDDLKVPQQKGSDMMVKKNEDESILDNETMISNNVEILSSDDNEHTFINDIIRHDSAEQQKLETETLDSESEKSVNTKLPILGETEQGVSHVKRAAHLNLGNRALQCKNELTIESDQFRIDLNEQSNNIKQLHRTTIHDSLESTDFGSVQTADEEFEDMKDVANEIVVRKQMENTHKNKSKLKTADEDEDDVKSSDEISQNTEEFEDTIDKLSKLDLEKESFTTNESNKNPKLRIKNSDIVEITDNIDGNAISQSYSEKIQNVTEGSDTLNISNDIIDTTKINNGIKLLGNECANSNSMKETENYSDCDEHCESDKIGFNLNEERNPNRVTKEECKAVKRENSYSNNESSTNELVKNVQCIIAHSKILTDNCEKETRQEKNERNPLLMDLGVNDDLKVPQRKSICTMDKKNDENILDGETLISNSVETLSSDNNEYTIMNNTIRQDSAEQKKLETETLVFEDESKSTELPVLRGNEQGMILNTAAQINVGNSSSQCNNEISVESDHFRSDLNNHSNKQLDGCNYILQTPVSEIYEHEDHLIELQEQIWLHDKNLSNIEPCTSFSAGRKTALLPTPKSKISELGDHLITLHDMGLCPFSSVVTNAALLPTPESKISEIDGNWITLQEQIGLHNKDLGNTEPCTAFSAVRNEGLLQTPVSNISELQDANIVEYQRRKKPLMKNKVGKAKNAHQKIFKSLTTSKNKNIKHTVNGNSTLKNNKIEKETSTADMDNLRSRNLQDRIILKGTRKYSHFFTDNKAEISPENICLCNINDKLPNYFIRNINNNYSLNERKILLAESLPLIKGDTESQISWSRESSYTEYSESENRNTVNAFTNTSDYVPESINNIETVNSLRFSGEKIAPEDVYFRKPRIEFNQTKEMDPEKNTGVVNIPLDDEDTEKAKCIEQVHARVKLYQLWKLQKSSICSRLPEVKSAVENEISLLENLLRQNGSLDVYQEITTTNIKEKEGFLNTMDEAEFYARSSVVDDTNSFSEMDESLAQFVLDRNEISEEILKRDEALYTGSSEDPNFHFHPSTSPSDTSSEVFDESVGELSKSIDSEYPTTDHVSRNYISRRANEDEIDDKFSGDISDSSCGKTTSRITWICKNAASNAYANSYESTDDLHTEFNKKSEEYLSISEKLLATSNCLANPVHSRNISESHVECMNSELQFHDMRVSSDAVKEKAFRDAEHITAMTSCEEIREEFNTLTDAGDTVMHQLSDQGKSQTDLPIYHLKYENLDLEFSDSSPFVTIRLIDEKDGDGIKLSPKYLRMLKDSLSSSNNASELLIPSIKSSSSSGNTSKDDIIISKDNLQMSVENKNSKKAPLHLYSSSKDKKYSPEFTTYEIDEIKDRSDASISAHTKTERKDEVNNPPNNERTSVKSMTDNYDNWEGKHHSLVTEALVVDVNDTCVELAKIKNDATPGTSPAETVDICVHKTYSNVTEVLPSIRNEVCAEDQTTSTKTNEICVENQARSRKMYEACAEGQATSTKTNEVCAKNQATSTKTKEIRTEDQTTSVKSNEVCAEDQRTSSKTNEVCAKEKETSTKAYKTCKKDQATSTKKNEVCAENQAISTKTNEVCAEDQSISTKTKVCAEDQAISTKTNEVCAEGQSTSTKTNEAFETSSVSKCENNADQPFSDTSKEPLIVSGGIGDGRLESLERNDSSLRSSQTVVTKDEETSKDLCFEAKGMKLNYKPNSEHDSVEVKFRRMRDETRLTFKSPDKKLYVKMSSRSPR